MKKNYDEIKKNLDTARKYNKQARILSVIALIISLLGLKEFISSKENEKKLPLFIKVVSYILMMVILVIGLSNKEVLTLTYAALAPQSAAVSD